MVLTEFYLFPMFNWFNARPLRDIRPFDFTHALTPRHPTVRCFSNELAGISKRAPTISISEAS